MAKERTLEEIKSKLKDGSAVVLTAQELCQMTQKGKKVKFKDVDVVTTATKGLMSGTSAIMAFRVSPPGKFKRVKSLSMNDIPCYVGPAPNETLGMVDLIIYATDKSVSNPRYGAGHLLRELVEGKPIKVKATSIEGIKIEKTITIEDIYFAKMMGIRHCFRNYNSFVNPSDKPVKSIFTVLPLQPHTSEITFCGCGVLNPLENDPHFDIIGVGTPLLINGAIGYVIGSGTRSSHPRPNLMTMAPLFDMKPEFMGGFVTSEGPEVIVSIGTAIPIINEKIFNNLKILDSRVPLNVVDIVGRKVLTSIDYGKVWHGPNYDHTFLVKINRQKCKECPLRSECPAEKYCPTDAFSSIHGIDRSRCFNCGTCIYTCTHGAVEGNLGEVEIQGKKIPIKLRESDRSGAIKLMNLLKKKVLNLEFPLALPVAKPKIYVEKIENKRESVDEK
ncbi:MAG: methanogenesis marker 16 metalloprotein [Candidatus Lokiarchaeota archaeon]|nr:methanogenesis marker 16 metalloprotein [Candidatus Lokiarchaeota archaeon]